MKKYLEKKIQKYVIATLDTPTLYLRKVPGAKEYSFVEDIEAATKSLTIAVIEQLFKGYYLDTGLDTEMVIVPVEITYEIIDDEQY